MALNIQSSSIELKARQTKGKNLSQWLDVVMHLLVFFFSSRRRHTRFDCDWSSDVCSSDLRPGSTGRAAGFLGIALVAGCASGGTRTATAGSPTPVPPAAPPLAAVAQDTTREGGLGSQYPSSYRRHPNPPVLIRNATIMTAAGQEIQGGSILFKDGRIVSVGTTVQAPSDAVVADGTGKLETAGGIGTDSHNGVYSSPGAFAESDGDEP